jgi:hypothetical protein
MPEIQQSTRVGQNVSMSSAGVGEEGQSMPPKTDIAGVRPHEMNKVDIGVLVRKTRVNAFTRDNHGFAPQTDVVLADIRAVHVLQESETEKAKSEDGRGVLFNLE